MSSSIDLSGGSLVVTYNNIPGQRGFTEPWVLGTQRFDADGAARSDRLIVATDTAGVDRVLQFAGAVTTTGWTFMAWETKREDFQAMAALHGVWINPAGAIGAPFAIGAVPSVSSMAVEALAGGGVGIAQHPDWLYQLQDGATGSNGPGWLAAYPQTRLGIVRGGRAQAMMIGIPYWQGSDGGGCQSEVTVQLVAANGTKCGSISLPVPTLSSLNCLMTNSSAALARDGTVVVHTNEYGTAADGNHYFASVARWWPKLLR